MIKRFNWISTNEGLNRFDGINNTIFRSNPFDNKTISNNSSKSVFQIDNDGVFIATSSGLDYFNYEKLAFERIESKSSPTSFYSYDNYVFVPTEEEGLFIYDTKKDSILDDLKFDPRNPLSISSSIFNDSQNENILLSLYGGDSTLWIGTTNGLNRYNLSNKSNKRFYNEESITSIPSNFIYDIFSKENQILVATEGGLAIINKNDNSIKQIDFFKNSEVYDLFEVSGNLLIHSEKGIIMVKNLDENKFEILYSDNLITVKKINNNEFVLLDRN